MQTYNIEVFGQGAYARGTITSSVYSAGTIPSLCGVVPKGEKWEECCAGAQPIKRAHTS
ncbi:hypothetical protein DPMN_158654 [Dreissena polymorpha]|uniref:Uncharacterized protein n=1 Tax=Dreissena polymorpha TaxID=45954 RepID=A0A9D4IQ05_DREPO|nr:hypothetical protein DPMN_158654 [Dreissena polymorpha]